MKTRASGMPPEAMWDSFFDPETILHTLALTASCEDLVEFGCGYGTFSISAARIVTGIVHTIDIDPVMVEATRANANAAALSNVNVNLRDFTTDGTGLPDI